MEDIRKEREKMEEVQFNQEFDFSKDFSSHNIMRNDHDDSEEEARINELSALDNGMEDVKELKRLLCLAKMKLRRNDPSINSKNIQHRAIKVKRKGRNPRKVKTGYVKKRIIKNSRDKILGHNNMFSYQLNNLRGQISTGNTNRNKMSREYLHQDSLFNRNNNEYIIKSENLIPNHKHEHQSSIDNNRMVYPSDENNVINLNHILGLSHEGFKTDNFKSRRSLVRSSSTNFNARLSYHPDYQVPSNLPSERNHIYKAMYEK